MLTRTFRALALVTVTLLAGGCKAFGGSFLLFGGSHTPQEDLVSKARAAERESVETREDFAAAFLSYQRLTAPQALELEKLCDEFEDAVDACENRSEDLDDRIETIRREKEELVKDWTEELEHFTSDAVRKKSAVQMQETDARAQRLLDALEKLQGRMKPVLLKLQDYRLFFDHNLNARAIATLQDTYKEFDAECKALESEIGKAQGEIAAFLAYFVELSPPKPAAQASK